MSRSVAKGSPSPRSLSLGWVARRYSPLETIVPFVPGPMILGAQAPGKVESTLQEFAL